MKQSLRALVATASAVTILAFVAGTASAQTAADAKCHSTIAKNITKYQAAQFKNQASCHSSRNGGKIASSTLCNDVMGADLKGGRTGARQKAIDGINKSCLLPASAAVLARYPRCPSPAKTSDDGGATTGIDTFTELATCLLDLSEAYVELVGPEVMGYPSAGILPLSKPLAACTGAIGKSYGKTMGTAGKNKSKCQGTQEKALGGLDYDNCATAADSKLSDALAALDTAIATSCGPLSQAQLASLGLCGQNTAALQTCVVDRVVKPIGNGLVAAAFELPSQCASFADVVANAGTGAKLSNTRLDSGYTGLAHDVDVTDGFLGGVELSGCDADCENCNVEIDPANGYCRCDNNVTIECSTVNGADAACSGGNCTCMFGPPLPLSSGGTPVCVVNKFAEQFDGTTGAIGEYDVGTRTRAVVHLGISQLQPCPICEDPAGAPVEVANDGTRSGVCSGGVRNGQTCDVNATHPDFGPTSFDCPPAAATNVTGGGLSLALRFSSGSQSLSGGIASVDAPAQCASGTCLCGECSGDATVGCNSDTDCDVLGVGTCTGTTHAASKPNECGTACTAVDAGGVGTCSGGPTDGYCDGALRADGRGIIPCTPDDGDDMIPGNADDDGDCRALDPICEGGGEGACGACTSFSIRSCFGPAISATGVPGIFNSEGVSTFCTAATSNTGVNSAGGLPGPGKVRLDFDFNVLCSDHTTQYELPGGSNCP